MGYSIMNKLLLLSFFLLLPTITQCMKRLSLDLTDTQPQQKRTLKGIRTEIVQHIHKTACIHFEQSFYQENHESTLFFCESSSFLNRYKSFNVKGYSFLGLAVICIKGLEEPPAEPSFFEKKQFIQKLLTLGFQPTKKDKKLAALEKKERCLPSIIHKMIALQFSPTVS